MSMGLYLGLLPGVLAGGGSVAPTALPQTGAMVAHWDAGAITPQTDNTNLATWTDSINGAVATSGVAPKYRTTGLNGLPFVQSTGTQYMDAGRPTALTTAIDSGTYTIIVVAQNIGVKTNGMLFGANTTGTNGPYILGNGARAGCYNASNTKSIPWTTGFVCIGDTSYNSPYAGMTGMRRHSLNNTIFQEENAKGPVSNGNFGLFGRATGAIQCAADIYNILVWNVALTPPEVIQVTKWACDKYAQAYPWAGASKFYIFSGDSLTVGQNASTPTASYPYLMAANLGLTVGQWTNLGMRGVTMPNMDAVGAIEVDPIPAMVGLPCVLSTFEWFNQAGSAPTPENNSRAYLAARKAANPTMKIAFGTSTDAASGLANRTNYNAAFDASHALNIDGYAAIHLNANIGIAGANANTTYFAGDNIHLTDLGYSELYGVFQPIVSVL